MAGLPHWDNSQAARNYYEPLFQNQFEVIITPPAAIASAPNVELLVEHVLKVDGLPEKTSTESVKQYYKFAERNYLSGFPGSTSVQLSLDFEVNLNEENNMYIYNILRAWSDLGYDPMTGRQGLKKDYVGEIYIAVHNKAGEIYREFRFKPAYIEGVLPAMSLQYENMGEIYRMRGIKFRCDIYKETRIGQIAI